MNKNKYNKLLIFFTDLVSISISYSLASAIYLLGIKNNSDFFFSSFVHMYLYIFLGFLISQLANMSKNMRFFERNLSEELFNVLKNTLSIVISMIFLIFIMKQSIYMSRGVILVTTFIYVFINLLSRTLLKKVYSITGKKIVPNILIISTKTCMTNIDLAYKVEGMMYGKIIGWVKYKDGKDNDDKNDEEQTINYVSSFDNVLSYIQTHQIDGLLILMDDYLIEKNNELFSKIQEMGIPIHYKINIPHHDTTQSPKINYVRDYAIGTYTVHNEDEITMMLKRLMDIVGSLVGIGITGVVGLFLGPIIKLESEGPILFKQKRVGKNGKYFEIYKFRSMGITAERDKESLMSKNEVTGHMFKMKNDPRITKVGKIIRKTSLDELPQFINVLKGDMSLVGTRPPTVDEYHQYKPQHKRRLSMRPGITGLWQVSGRSDISDFEEVVALDTTYIDNHSISLDIKILIKTLGVVFMKRGSQ